MTEDEELVAAVRTHGWQAISISDCDPPFLYSVGLSETFSHPEVIVFGLPANNAYRLIADLVEGLRKGLRFDISGTSKAEVFATEVGFRPVDETQHPLYIGYAMGFCRLVGVRLKAMQVFWPDSKGKFPFETNCEERCYTLQPRLDIPLTSSESDEYRWMDDV